MSNSLEVLVTCDTNNTLWTSCIWDPLTGSSLMTYRGGGTAEPKTLNFIGTDYISSVEKSKPILHIWPLNSQQTVQGMRFILPGKASAFAVSRDGSYCIAGIDEKIYLWQIASGSLITILNRHYQKVVHLKFTPDGKFFISAAEDGMVMVWSLVTVATHPEVELVTQTTAGQHDPIHVFSDHSLPVTDLYVSKMGVTGRLCTVSSDRTCKIYDLASGELLLNLVFDMPLLSVTMDVLELNVFVGTTEGKIYQFSLTNPPRNRDLLVNTDECISFTSHTKGVTCLSVSLDGETLASGGNDEQVILWHIRSKQSIRSIKHKGPITNICFTVNFPAIHKQEFHPTVILHSLERTLEKDSDIVHEIEVLVNTKTNFWPKIAESNKIIEPKVIVDEEIPNDFKKKEDKLKADIEHLKKINAHLFEFSMKKALNRATENTNKNKKKKKN